MSRTTVLGPWIQPAEKVIAKTDASAGIYGPGHGCVFHPEGRDEWYFIHLEYGRGSTNRQTFAQKMAFNPDGTIKPVTLTNQGVGPIRQVLPRRPNLALTGAATASSVRPDWKINSGGSLNRTETFAPDLAIDDSNGSRWMAAIGDATPWWQIDLGAARDIVGTEAYFVKPAAGHAYKLEASLDGGSGRPMAVIRKWCGVPRMWIKSRRGCAT